MFSHLFVHALNHRDWLHSALKSRCIYDFVQPYNQWKSIKRGMNFLAANTKQVSRILFITFSCFAFSKLHLHSIERTFFCHKTWSERLIDGCFWCCEWFMKCRLRKYLDFDIYVEKIVGWSTKKIKENKKNSRQFVFIVFKVIFKDERTS